MSEPITSVTEGRVTVTANDTEENIREAAGFSEAAEPDAPASKVDKDSANVDKEAERNPDGTFKAKAEKPAEPDAKPVDGDPRKSHQAKINQAIAKQREAERRAEETERRLAEREAELEKFRRPATPTQPTIPEPAPVSSTSKYVELVKKYQGEPDAPKYDDFVAAGLDDPYTAHRDAMSIYVAERFYQEQQAGQVEAARHREADARINQAYELVQQRGGLDPRQDDRKYPIPVLQAIARKSVQDPELSADIMHHLMTHPDDASRLASAEFDDPIAAAEEIGRLTALVSASSGPEPVTTQTNAKPLIKPVRTSIVAPESSPPEDLPFGPRYIAAMNERDRKAREARRA